MKEIYKNEKFILSIDEYKKVKLIEILIMSDHGVYEGCCFTHDEIRDLIKKLDFLL